MYDHLQSPFIEITTNVDTDTVGMMYRTPSSVIAHFKCDHKMILQQLGNMKAIHFLIKINLIFIAV